MPYGLGKLADIYRPAPGIGPVPVVLLWHGIGPDERAVLEPVAAATAGHGVIVCVPDWRADAPDGGRAQLLASIGFTREAAAGLGGKPDRIVLAGWSRGGKAAASVAMNPSVADGWRRPCAVACLGSGFNTLAPTTGSAPIDDLRQSDLPPVPFRLVHGTADPVVDIARSRSFAAALAEHGWPVRLEEPATDHAGVVMAEYDPEIRRCRPARAGHAITAGRQTARILAAAAS